MLFYRTGTGLIYCSCYHYLNVKVGFMSNENPVPVVQSVNNGIIAIVTVADHSQANVILTGEGDPLIAGCRKFTFGQLTDPEVSRYLSGSTKLFKDLVTNRKIIVVQTCGSSEWGHYVPFSNGRTTLDYDLKYCTTKEELLAKFNII